jgi:hypothetical protein
VSQGEASRSRLSIAVGIAALAAPALHSITDMLEWYQGGFSATQLWLNYIAFLPMPWLLLGLYSVRQPRPDVSGLIGALLYGVAFVYFAHTTLYAITEQVPTYEALWARLGSLYTVHGAFMVLGGLMFARSALHAGWLPRWPLVLFASGIAVNLLVALMPAPDMLQTIGSTVRNLGLMAMGYGILFKRPHAVVKVW